MNNVDLTDEKDDLVLMKKKIMKSKKFTMTNKYQFSQKSKQVLYCQFTMMNITGQIYKYYRSISLF